MQGQAGVEAGVVLDRRFGAVGGVLFDIDDTLVDLAFSMTTALRDVSEHLLPGLDQAGWERFGRIFTHETTHYYDRYLAGELTFNEQRLLRGRAAEVSDEAEEEIDVGEDVNQQRHVYQDEEGALDRRALAELGEEDEEGGDSGLREDGDVGRAPARVDAAEGGGEVAVESDREGDARRPRQPRAQAPEPAEGGERGRGRRQPPQGRAQPIREHASDSNGLERRRDDL